jgi:hypothetical protein
VKKRRIDVERISPPPTDEERAVLEAALEEIVERERQATASSLWLRAARSQGRRLGMLDYRDRFAKDDAWRLSTRFPFGGREYPGLNGRADAK